jgi:flagellar biosynthesis protein FlhF
MRLRRFEATTVREALARVKAELGPEAVILHARSTGAPRHGGWVEVTAAVDNEPLPGDADRPEAMARGDATMVAPSPPLTTRDLPDTGSTHPDGWEGALEEIQRTLLELRCEAGPSPRLPAALRPAYRRLLVQEVPGRAARRLLLALPSEIRSRRGGPDGATLQEAVARRFRVSGPITPGRRQRAIAHVGPTGVGKTTTIAKLAGQLRHTGGLKIALLTLDTYRIGGVAQMRIYAELLGVALHVVRTPAEVRAALQGERGADLVLVDTTGRSPRQPEGIAAMGDLLREIPNLETHLVLSATTKTTDLEEILKRFRPLQYHCILVTKVDEARTLGPLLGLALERELVISYLGTGQEVPDDLEAATPRRLAGLLVGETRSIRRRATTTT